MPVERSAAIALRSYGIEPVPRIASHEVEAHDPATCALCQRRARLRQVPPFTFGAANAAAIATPLTSDVRIAAPQPPPEFVNGQATLGPDERERREIARLQETDRAVRAHQEAHVRAAAGHASGAALSYVTGPDGRRYAVAGEANVDLSRVPGDPDATRRKAAIVKAAALAPVDPSPEDYRTAAEADALARAAAEEAAGDASHADPRVLNYGRSDPTPRGRLFSEVA